MSEFLFALHMLPRVSSTQKIREAPKQGLSWQTHDCISILKAQSPLNTERSTSPSASDQTQTYLSTFVISVKEAFYGIGGESTEVSAH